MIGATFCSGIGAPEVAAPWVDWRLASEIEPFPRAVLAERFGYVVPEDQNQGEPLLWGDMAGITPDLWREHGIPLPNIVVAGTPCQPFSVAGLRKGLKDDRGNLTLKFVELCHDIVTSRPDGKLIVLWENVPGVLSDRGNAFGAFLGGLVGAMDALSPPADGSWPGEGMVEGPRARAAWAVLDAQYFGVAQRRRRVFVVVDFGNAVDPAAVLFEPESLRGNSPTRRKEGQGITRGFETGPHGGGFTDVAPTLDTSCKDGPVRAQIGAGAITARMTKIGEYADDDIASSLKARDFKDATDLVAHSLRGEGYDASEDGTGRGTPLVPVAGAICKDSFSGGAGGRPEGAAAGHFIPVAFDCKAGGKTGLAIGDITTSLRGEGHGGGHAAIAIQERAVSENPDSGPDGAGFRDDDAAYTLEARTVPQAVAFQDRFRGDDGRGYDRPPSASIEHTGSLETVKPWNVAQTVAFDLRGREGGAMPEGPHDTANIRAASGGSSRSYVASPYAVRRLTPTECHRLQGFKDDHCAITYRGKAAADGPQYKALGNSMAVPVVRWIMDRIRASAAEQGK